MVRGIRPGVPDSLICVKKSFLMNTDHLDGVRVGCQSACLARVTAARVVLLLTLVLELPRHMSEYAPLNAKATPVPTHIKATW